MRRILALTAALALGGLAVALPSATEAAAPHEMNLGSLAPEGTPWRAMLDRIETEVETGSNGRINVIIRPPGLMAEVEMVRETRSGERLQGAAVTTAALAEGGNVPLLQLVELPFLFDTIGEADKLLDEVLWDDFSSLLERRGFKLVLWSENGWRSFGTKDKPVKAPADLKGLKMRAQESDVHMAMYKAFGANAVQKPMTEVLTSLQGGVIDGLDNTPLYTLSGGLAEPLDYFTKTEHIYQPAAAVYSRRWFSQLEPDLQALVMSVKKHTDSARKEIRSEGEAIEALFPQMGLEVVELTAEERTAFKTLARSMHRGFAGGLEGGTALYDKIDKALQGMR